ETFLQLVNEHTGDPNSVRFILVTDDKLLKDALAKRIKEKHHVLTADSIETVKSMLNAHASHIAGELNELLKKATHLFFQESERNSLFYKWQIEQTIRDSHGDLELSPNLGDVRGQAAAV